MTTQETSICMSKCYKMIYALVLFTVVLPLYRHPVLFACGKTGNFNPRPHLSRFPSDNSYAGRYRGIGTFVASSVGEDSDGSTRGAPFGGVGIDDMRDSDKTGSV